jgi:acetyl-CoA acetyltransferase
VTGVALAWVPYGGYWATPFVRWQGAFADLHSLQFAGWVAKRALAKRKIDLQQLDFGVLGFTVPQSGSFYGLPWIAGEMGAAHIAGPTIMQACATSARCVQVAAAEIHSGAATAALVLTGDRVSNGPHLYYPSSTATGGTGQSENWVLDNFSADPFAKVAMVQTAENVARKWSISRDAQDDVTLMRAEQYLAAVADDNAFQKRFMDLPFGVPNSRFSKTVGQLPGDIGIQPSNPEKLRFLTPVVDGGTVTYGGQTHPADGNAGMIVTNQDKAQSLSQNSGIHIAILGFGTARVEPAFMPAAPVPASHNALAMAGMSIADIDVVKSHNPFSVNDIVFSLETGFPLAKMNNFGCSLVWGHPQGPTGLRGLIELIEELAQRGGGYGLFQGCAAGDSAMAVVIKVSG